MGKNLFKNFEMFFKNVSRIFFKYFPKSSHKNSQKASGCRSCYFVRTLLQKKFMTLMLLIFLRFIVWPTSLIWWSRHCQVYLWWCTMRIYYNVCIPILHIHLRGTFNSQNLWISWQQRETIFFKMSKQECWALLRELW